MARKNLVLLTGMVGSPIKIQTKDGVRVARFKLVMGRQGHEGEDKPFVEVGGDAIAFAERLAIGDFVHVEGELHTKSIKYSTECSDCHTKIYKDILVTTVYSENITVFPASETAFFENHVFLLGHVVQKPMLFRTVRGVPKTKYQIVIKRFRNDTSADFPYVASYKRLAQQDSERMIKGSMVFIDGAIQTVQRPYTLECPDCFQHELVTFSLLEVVSKSSEYLYGCVFPENDDPNHWKLKELERNIGA